MRASGAVSVFPMPGTPVASPSTTISFRGVEPGQLGTIVVNGRVSGAHPGRLVAHSDGSGASFVPATPFTPGETVDVGTTLAIRGAKRGGFSFTIARAGRDFDANQTPKTNAPASPPRFISRPDLHPPAVTVNKVTPDTAAGAVFLTANPTLGQAVATQSGPMIVDGRGALVWFAPAKPVTTLDFQVQQYEGQPVLSWFEGTLTSGGYGDGTFVLYDQTYRKIREVAAGNGYEADVHDFVITPRNTALLLAYNPVLAPKGVTHRVYDRDVLDAVVQEVDIPTGAVLFEWHSVGTVELSESYLPAPDDLAEPYDYVHPNSIALDGDGNIWLSARHTSAVYKLDRATGALYWRLGGKRSNFDMDKNTKFMWQHDVRPRGDSLVTVFDNAASAPGVASRSTSRVLSLDVNERSLHVSLERASESPQRALALSQGNAQLLANGNLFVGWGSVPEYTEFGPFGTVKLDVTIADGAASYRAFRFPWTGRPAAPPAVALRRAGNALLVAASWNGATGVTRWRVRAGPDRDHLFTVGAYTRTGFETKMRLAGQAAARAVAVQALGADGRVLATAYATTS